MTGDDFDTGRTMGSVKSIFEGWSACLISGTKQWPGFRAKVAKGQAQMPRKGLVCNAGTCFAPFDWVALSEKQVLPVCWFQSQQIPAMYSLLGLSTFLGGHTKHRIRLGLWR